MSLETFMVAYVESALWSSTYLADENGDPVSEEGPGTRDLPMDDTFGPEDIAPATLTTINEECSDFYANNVLTWTDAGMSDDSAGQEFWLTRNRHGAGFWDRGLGDAGKVLTDAAHAYGSYDLYVGDDGLVYGN